MDFLLLLVTFLCAVTSCLGYGSGAPEGVCSDLLPHHRGATPQDDRPPYTVSARIINDNKVEITIYSPRGVDFKGFFLQARSSEDRTKLIAGEFETSDISQTRDCGGKRKSALTHVSANAKSQVVTKWTPTAPVNEDIVFRATVVKSYADFWEKIDSQPVKIRTRGQTPSSDRRNSNEFSIYDDCFKTKGCFGYPENCADSRDCTVLLTYETDSNRSIRFTMHGFLGSSEYMAMALSDDDKMGSDYVTECFQNSSGNPILQNSWNEGKGNSRSEVARHPFEFMVRNGLTTCTWTKPYTIPAYGRVYYLDSRKYNILLAKGPVENNRIRRHTGRLATADGVNFTAVGAVASGGVTDSVKIHGTFMVTAWVGFVSIAILLARHFKNVWENSTLGGVKIWFALHRGFVLTALVFIIISLIVIFVHKEGWNYTIHAALGISATCLGILNPIMALFRPAPDHPKRVIFNWLHWIVGNSAQIIAVLTIFFAVPLQSAGLSQSFYWVMAVFVIIHLLFHLLYQVHSWTEGKKKSNELGMNEMNGARGGSNVQNGHNSQAKKVSSDVFRILLLGIYCIFLLVILIALYALIGVA